MALVNLIRFLFFLFVHPAAFLTASYLYAPTPNGYRPGA
jgi:hypothetical protein